MNVKEYTHSILNVFQNESKCKVNFFSTFQFFEYIIHLIFEQTHIEGRRMTWQSWRLCVFYSLFQYLSKSFRKNQIPLSNFDHQHLPLCPPHQYCRVSRSSTIGISFMWTPWIWLVLSPSILLMNKLNPFVVSSSSRWVPCKWRASAEKRHKLLLYDCLVFSSYLRQLIVWFLSRGSGKTAFLHPIRTCLSKAANTVKFVYL